jgi:hypothetical protein
MGSVPRSSGAPRSFGSSEEVSASYLCLRNVVKSYDGKSNAVDDISIDIERGDFITLLGPSGVTSLGEHDAPALDLLPVEAHEPLAMWTVDRKLASDGKPEVRIAAAESRLLECDQSGALWIAAPDRQIPVGRTCEIFDREFWAVRLMHSDSCLGRRAPAAVT